MPSAYSEESSRPQESASPVTTQPFDRSGQSCVGGFLFEPVRLQPCVSRFPRPGAENDHAALLWRNPVHHAIAPRVKAGGIETLVALENRVGKLDWEFLEQLEEADSLKLCGVG